MGFRNSKFACVVLAAAVADAQPVVSAFDHEHRPFGEVLTRFVKDGRVDYAGLQRDRRQLDSYRASLGEVAESQLKTWSRDQQLAFWINAYNANVLATIIDHYPISRGTLVGVAFPANSIWQISGAFKTARHRLAGKMRSLDNIEHDIVRPGFREPRVHFALVCAARGCPPLRAEPFVSTNLSSQLDEQTRAYLTDRVHGLSWRPATQQLQVSTIFKWFAEDFVTGGGLREFLARHTAEASVATAIRNPANKLRYLDYDWTLNER